MAFLPFALPEGLSEEEFRNLVSPELWERDPQQAAILAWRRSGCFDETAYLQAYPDIARNGMGAIEHYVRHGYKEERLRAFSQAPKVSVLVPVYNNSQYLHECIDSILNQTLRDIEIIIIDDGSTDPDAIAILDNYAEQDNRITVIHKHNTGYGHSMNVGLHHARGEYIAIVESDDYILKDMFEVHVHYADKYNADFIKSSFKRFKGEGKARIFEDAPISKDTRHFNCQLDPFLNIQLFKQTNVIWNGIYRKQFLEKYHIRFNETPGASYQDNGFWFQTFIYTNNFRIIPEAFYMLRRDNSESSFFSKKKVFCMCDEYQFILNILKKDSNLYKRFINIFHLKKFYNYMFTLNRIGNEYKTDFITRFSQEFKEAQEHGELDRELFTQREWENIQHLLRDPQAFLSRVLSSTEKKSPDVSVIIAVYNAEKYLEACLESLRVQTLRNIEILCVDDGSEDHSFAILTEFSKKDSRFHAIQRPHANAGAARNYGLKKAHGQYVIFLDADDYFDSQMLEKMYYNCCKNQSDFCVCRSKRFEKSVHDASPIDWTVDKTLLPQSTVFSPEDVKHDIFRLFIGWAWDKMYKRSFLEKFSLQFQEQRSTNDMLFTFSALILASRISICNDYLVFQRTHVATSISNTREKSWMCFVDALRAVKNMLLKYNKMKRFEKDFISYCVHTYIWNFQSLKGKAAVALQKYGKTFDNEFSISKKSVHTKFFRDFIEIIS